MSPVARISGGSLVAAQPGAMSQMFLRRSAHRLRPSRLQAVAQQMQLLASALRQISTPQPVHAAAAPATTPQAAAEEGRLLNLQLGAFPLLEQQCTLGPAAAGPAAAGATQAQGSPRSQVFKFIAPADVDQVMDVYMEHGIMDADPYWCRTWPSAVALASELLARPELVRGKRVADLGCGLGLAGIAAACAGAAEVVLLDREPLALQCALLSAVATAGPAVSVQGIRTDDLASATGAPIQASPSEPSPTSPSPTQPQQHTQPQSQSQQSKSDPRDYCFNGPEITHYTQQSAAAAAAAGSGPHGGRQPCLVRGVEFDWNKGADALVAGTGRFDVVLACDVLYEADFVEPVARLAQGVIKASDGYLLLADPPNRTAYNRQRFLELLAQTASQASPAGSTPAAKPAARKAKPACLILEECRVVDSCRTLHLDPEMRGGMGQGKEEVVPVQLAVFRSVLGTDTVGMKLS